MEAHLREKGMEPGVARALAALEPAPLLTPLRGGGDQGMACKPENTPRADGACPRDGMSAYRLPDGSACCMQNDKISEALLQSKEYQARKPFYDGLVQARKLLKLEGKIRRYGTQVCQRTPPIPADAPAVAGAAAPPLPQDAEYQKYLRKYRRAAAKVRAIRQWFADPSRVSDDLGSMCQFLQLHAEEARVTAELGAKTDKLREIEDMDRAARARSRRQRAPAAAARRRRRKNRQKSGGGGARRLRRQGAPRGGVVRAGRPRRRGQRAAGAERRRAGVAERGAGLPEPEPGRAGGRAGRAGHGRLLPAGGEGGRGGRVGEPQGRGQVAGGQAGGGGGQDPQLHRHGRARHRLRGPGPGVHPVPQQAVRALSFTRASPPSMLLLAAPVLASGWLLWRGDTSQQASASACSGRDSSCRHRPRRTGSSCRIPRAACSNKHADSRHEESHGAGPLVLANAATGLATAGPPARWRAPCPAR